MISHERELVAFLAGDLEPDERRRFDAHLLRCDACWRALRQDRWARQALELLRLPAPGGLAERVAMGVELASDRSPRRRGGRVLVAAALVAALGLAGGLGLSFAPSSPPAAPRAPQGAVGTVVRFAQLLPAPSQPSSTRNGSVPSTVGQPLELDAGGQRFELTYYAVDGREEVVATSTLMFPMPAGGVPLPIRQGSQSQGWKATSGGIQMYCQNAPVGPSSVLVAGTGPISALEGLLARIPLG